MNPDPQTVQVVVQGVTALVALVVGWLLRHLTVPRGDRVPPAAPNPGSHPVLDAIAGLLLDRLLKQPPPGPTPPAGA